MSSRRLLELQSDRIEMVMATHKARVRVIGGVVTPRSVQFHLAPDLGTKINKIQALTDELALALGVPNVRVSRQGGNVLLEIPRDDAMPVKLLALMAGIVKVGAQKSQSPQSSCLPAETAVLGLCYDGAPLLMRLSSPDVAHVLISGTTGSGKTTLCQTMILNLAMTHRRSQLQFVLVDPKRRAFAPFAPLPHLLRPIIGEADEAASALGELVQLMERRAKNRIYSVDDKKQMGKPVPPDLVTPRIVVVLDELADLMQVGGQALAEPLARLVQRGSETGIHIIACTQKPSAQVMGTLIRSNFPARLVGKVVSPEDARVASGIGGTGAEKLSGRGDFIAVAAGQVLRFQAAYVSSAEMEQVVAQFGSVPRRGDVMKMRPSLLRQAAQIVAC